MNCLKLQKRIVPSREADASSRPSSEKDRSVISSVWPPSVLSSAPSDTRQRPIMASFAMLALVAALSVTWIERHEAASSVETIASNSVEITLDGDTYSLAE